MASSSTPQTWLVERLPTATDRGYNKRRSKLSDAVHSGDWTLVFSIFEDAHKRYHECWIDCPTSTDGWTPLHHAAYKGAPVSTVRRLIEMGASRSIRTVHTHGTSLSRNDRTPLGIAIEMKHKELYEVLKPVFRFVVSEAVLQRLETHFHKLIRDQTSWPNNSRIRLPKLGVLREGTGWGWFPVGPGVNRKGYLYRLRISVLQVWKFGAKGGLEEQKEIGEKDVVTVPKGDRDFVATPWKIARSSDGGTDMPYRNTVPTPNEKDVVTVPKGDRDFIATPWKIARSSDGGTDMPYRNTPNEKDVVTVPKGDRDFVATSWKIARSSDGGTDMPYRNTVPTPNHHQRTLGSTTTSSEAYTSYSASYLERLEYNESSSAIDTTLEYGIYDDKDVADPDEDPIDSLYYQWDMADVDRDIYDGNYNDLDGTYTDDDYYESDYTDLEMVYTDDEYYDDDCSNGGIAYADDNYYDGFYDDVDVAGPDDDLEGLDPDADPDDDLEGLDPDADPDDDLEGLDPDADPDYDLCGADPDGYPDIADPEVADPDVVDPDDAVEY